MNIVIHTIPDVAAFLFYASIKASLLVVLVLLVQRIFGRWLSPHGHYLLWLPVVVSLVTPLGFGIALPGDLQAPVAAYAATATTLQDAAPGEPELPAAEEADTRRAAVASLVSSPAAIAASAAPERATWLYSAISLLPYVWIAGVAVVLGAVAAASHRMAQSIRRASPAPAVLQDLLNGCLRQTHCSARVRLLQSTGIHAPMIAGIFRPVLLLPAGLEHRIAPAQLRHVFLHELMHLQRGDIVSNWIFAVVQALHWFNPLTWYAFLRMRQDRELACDAATLRHLAPGERAAYGHTLITLNDTLPGLRVPALALGMLHDGSPLRRRILALAAASQNSTRRSMTAALLLLPLAALAFGKPMPTTADDASSANAEVIGGAVPSSQVGSVGEAISPANVDRVATATRMQASADVPAPATTMSEAESRVTQSAVPSNRAGIVQPGAPDAVVVIPSVAATPASSESDSQPGSEATPEGVQQPRIRPRPADLAKPDAMSSTTVLAAVSVTPEAAAPAAEAPAAPYEGFAEVERLAATLAATKAEKLAFIEKWNAIGAKCDARKDGFLGALSASCQRIRTAQRRGEIFRYAYECYQLDTIYEDLAADYRDVAQIANAQTAREMLQAIENDLDAICSETNRVSNYPAFAAMVADAEALKYYPPRQPVSDSARVAAIEARVWRYHAQGTSASVIDPLSFPQPSAAFVPSEYPAYAPALPAPSPIAPAPAPAQ